MSRKNFMILSIIESILWIGAMVIGSMLDSKLWVTISIACYLSYDSEKEYKSFSWYDRRASYRDTKRSRKVKKI